jgi:hypothetical protein
MSVTFRIGLILLGSLCPPVIFANPWQVGDILLQPLDCSMCYLIEEEEQSDFSHIAIVVETQPEVLLAEALPPKTRLIKGSDILKRKLRHGKKNALYRLKNKAEVAQNNALKEHFISTFKDLTYDSAFLWNNTDSQGRELLYCSELVSKLLKTAWNIEIPTKAMHYEKNREAWEDYFLGDVPDGLPGNSPEDFLRSGLFDKVAEI